MSQTISSEVNVAYKPLFFSNDRFRIVYGGAGSGKSVAVFQWINTLMMGEPGHNFLITRKTAKSNRHSTFALMKQIIGPNAKYFDINKSDMTITSLLTKNKMIFSGLDNVEKLKSITFDTGVLTDIITEEASEIDETDFNQLNLRLRGLSTVPKTYTILFNPVDSESWLKKRFFDTPQENTQIVKTTYKNNRFIDSEYIKELERLKELDPVYYAIYALGEWGVLGNIIFTKYIIHDFDYNHITDRRAGLDFGYNVPSSFHDLGYYNNEIWVCNEFYAANYTNPELIVEIKKDIPNWKSLKVIADSAEPDRIAEFKKAGFSIRACKKGDQSIRHGISWLQSKTIHIHKTNCPFAASEIKKYKWREVKGVATDEPVTFNDHAMDDIRYGTEDWRLNNNEPTRIEVIKSSTFTDERGGW